VVSVRLLAGLRAWGRGGTDFQSRWIPRDMKSFMVSYEAATLVKTPATAIAISLVCWS
jgi:hypothetical protein